MLSVLPVEVEERIVDYLYDDIETLRNCAFVCRAWLPCSRRILLYSVHITSRKQLALLCELFRRHPALRPIVRCVAVSPGTPLECCADPNRDPTLLQIVSVKLLSELPNVRSWTVKTKPTHEVSCRRDTLLLSPISLACFKQYSSMRELILGDATFHTTNQFAHLVGAFPTLRHLTCEGIRISGFDLILDAARVLLSKSLSCLSSLDIQDVDASVANILVQAIPSTLKSLTLRLNQDDPRHDVLFSHSILLHLRQNLQFLRFRVKSDGDFASDMRSVHKALALARNTLTIQDLTLEISLVYIDELMDATTYFCDGYYRCRKLQETLEILQLQSVTFSFPVLRGKPAAQASACLSELFPALEKRGILQFRGNFNTLARAHQSSVRCLTFSLNSKTSASSSYDGGIVIWDARDGSVINTSSSAASGDDVYCLALSPDGCHLASITRKTWLSPFGPCLRTKICILSVDNGSETTILDQAWGAYAVVFDKLLWSPDGLTIVAYAHNFVRVWRVKRLDRHRVVPCGDAVDIWRPRHQIFRPRENPFVVVSPSRKYVVDLPSPALYFRERDTKVLVINDGASGAPIMALEGHSCINAASFSPDEKYVASGSEDHTVCLWRLSDGVCVQRFVEHDAPVTCVAFSPDGERLVSGDEVGVVVIRPLRHFLARSEYEPVGRTRPIRWTHIGQL